MQQRHLLPIIGFCLLLVAGILFFGKGRQSSSQVVPQLSLNSKSSPLTQPNTLEGSPANTLESQTATAENVPALSREAILEEINDAAVTYDVKGLPRIQPYLIHPDPDIREAAKNGMIVLGDAAAGPLLRDASRRVATPQEAVVLLEAADYVELPSGLILLNQKSTPGTKTTFGGAKKALAPKEGEAPSAPLTR